MSSPRPSLRRRGGDARALASVVNWKWQPRHRVSIRLLFLLIFKQGYYRLG